MKKLWSIAIIIIVTSLLSGCFGKSTNSRTIGETKFGFVDVGDTDWKPLEISSENAKDDMLSTLFFDKNTNSIELALYSKEDISSAVSLDEIAEDIKISILPYLSEESQNNSSNASDVSVENVDFGKDKYKAVSMTVNYVSDISKEKIITRAWVFLDENNLYRYVILDATEETFEELSTQVSKSFRLKS